MVIQKAQTALAMGLNQTTNLTVNWTWTRADDPYVENQQGTVAYSMNF